MSYEYSKLLGRIKEKYGSQSKFARMIGLSERTISLKLSSKVDWKQEEITQACKLLDIDNTEIPTYFFTAKIQY